jgi:hypothetical protein
LTAENAESHGGSSLSCGGRERKIKSRSKIRKRIKSKSRIKRKRVADTATWRLTCGGNS